MIEGWKKRREGGMVEEKEGREQGTKGDDDITLHVPSQLKELRAVARHESVDHQHFLSLLRGLEQPMLLSVRTMPL